MRIGLNLLYLLPGVVGGTETYAAGLLAGLAKTDRQDEFFVFVNKEAENWPLPAAENFTRVACPVRAVSRARRYFFEQTYLPKWLKTRRIDLVHSLGYVGPHFCPCPSVVTIHDLNYRAFGKTMSLQRKLALEFFVKCSARRAKGIIAVSEFGREEIVRTFGVDIAKIFVTYEAPHVVETEPMNFGKVLSKYGIKQPYIVAFSSSSPHKNIPRLIQAFARARNDFNLPHQLVMIGHLPAGEQNFLDMPGLVFTGYVDGPQKWTLLRGAEMLVFPSTYEGFGLPVLEAQQAGVPVLCSNAASLPEVAGEAAVYFDPLSVDEIAKGIGQAANDSGLREKLKQKGQENVGRFSWETTARKTLEVYEKALNL